MFSIFKRKANIVSDINWLGVDMHSHILPGIDDGSKSMNQTLGYIRSMQNLGFEKLLFTPHIFKELYPNTAETILPVLNAVQESLLENQITIPTGAAAEHMVDADFKVSDSLFCLPGKYLLIEMSYLSETPNIEQVVFELQIQGYNLILAHPERYNFYHKNIERYQRLKAMGCLFQLNLLSVIGYYGKEVKLAAEYLLGQSMYDLAASDLHHDKHLSILENAVRNGKLHQVIGHYEFKNKQIFG